MEKGLFRAQELCDTSSRWECPAAHKDDEDGGGDGSRARSFPVRLKRNQHTKQLVWQGNEMRGPRSEAAFAAARLAW